MDPDKHITDPDGPWQTLVDWEEKLENSNVPDNYWQTLTDPDELRETNRKS